MQVVIEQPSRSRQNLTKRISSANFNSKKIKAILSSRQTCDDIVLKPKQHDVRNGELQRSTDNLHNKNKKIPPQNLQIKVRPSSQQLLTELIKPIKHDKNQQQALLLKNCDKTKLIFWNKDIPISGNQKYLLVSADLIIDQDCFWDKLPSDNGNFPTTLHNSHTLTTINHNSTLTYRSRNNFSSNGHSKMLSGSTQTIPNANHKNKNPLLSSNKLTSLIKQWKNLHSRCDSEGRKLIVLWLIRKQNTYSHLLEFSQANQLPLHGIFYAKRKRANAFFDLGPIVKEIHQRFLQAVLNPQPDQANKKIDERKSIDLSKEMRKGRSKQIKNKQLIQTVTGFPQMKKKLDCLTNRVIKSKMDSNNLQNDQNSSAALNSQTCKEFALSKNSKRSLGSIVFDEKRVRSIIKKAGPASSNRVFKQGCMKINEIVENTTNDFRVKCDVSPIMDQVKQGRQQAVIKEFQVSQKMIKERKLHVPQIYIFEGVKCNSKGYCEGDTYHGKVPIVFDFHEQRLKKVVQKLKDHQIEINMTQEKDQVKSYHFKYQTIKQNALESINGSVKQLIMRNYPQNEFTYATSKVQEFREQKINQILEELSISQITRQKYLGFKTIDKDTEQMQLTESQEQLLMEKTEKKLQEIKKQAIDRMISLKGRHYTFQNGQSIYYFVGDAFKRNYNLLYGEYYKMYEKELLTTILSKNKHKEKSPTTAKTNDFSRTTDCTMMTQHTPGQFSRIKALKLANVRFFQSLNY